MKTPDIRAAGIPNAVRVISTFSLLIPVCLVGGPGVTQTLELTRFSYTQYHMGVNARIVVYAPDKSAAESACTAAFARIAALDSIMSDYRIDSELNRLSADSGGPPKRVSSDLFKVLNRAQEVAKRSGGAFDVTAGPLIQLWRAARKAGKLPDSAAIQEARKRVGWKKMRLDPRAQAVRLTTPGMKLDLGGIAKGYAADSAQRVLKQHGIKRALVELGGDIVVTDSPPGTKGWSIRIPNAGKDVILTNRAISTSGDTEQFTIIGGRRYSHVVDPRTGRALTNRVQATVIAPNGLTSDPLSTALTILDPRGRRLLLKSYPGTKAYVRVLEQAAYHDLGFEMR